MESPPTRASLLSRLRGDADSQAWREFEGAYRGLVLAYCRRSGLQHWDAEDVCQTVFVSLSTALRGGFRYRPEVGRFRSYLGRVVRNAVAAHSASAGRVPRPVDVATLAREGATRDDGVDERWEQEWRDHHLRRAMRSLEREASPRDWALFERLLEGATLSEVSREFALSEDGVHKVKQRVRTRLRERIADQVREEGP